MPSNHKGHPTISFRPSAWERNLIEQRAELCGYYKKDFIAKSCIYSNLLVLGNEANIGHIIDRINELEYVMKEIAEGISLGDIPVKEDSFYTMRDEYLAMLITVIDIIKGSAYLWNNGTNENGIDWKSKITSVYDKK